MVGRGVAREPGDIILGKPTQVACVEKKFRAAIGTAGMLKVIDDDKYHLSNPADNETIFHILQVATADGNASHLVDKYEKDRDDKKAYLELVRWHEGDQLTSETAEDARDRLSRISLNTKNTASEYINDFLEHQKHLEELDEAYTTSKTISIFLDQITDPDYVFNH